MAHASPRFRRDLEASGVEADGVQYVEVRDAATGTAFRFYDFEHAAALALDGRPLEVVASALREQSGLELSSDQLAAFADQLHELGFLEAGPPAPGAAPTQPERPATPAPAARSGEPARGQGAAPAVAYPPIESDSFPLVFGASIDPEPSALTSSFGLESVGEDETKLAPPGHMSSLLEELRASEPGPATGSPASGSPASGSPPTPNVETPHRTPPPVPVSTTPGPVEAHRTPPPVPVSTTPGPVEAHRTPPPVPVSTTPGPVEAHRTPPPVPVSTTPGPVEAHRTPPPVPTQGRERAADPKADATDFEWPPSPPAALRPAEPATETVSEFPPRIAPAEPALPAVPPVASEADRVTAPLRPSSLEALAAQMNAITPSPQETLGAGGEPTAGAASPPKDAATPPTPAGPSERSGSPASEALEAAQTPPGSRKPIDEHVPSKRRSWPLVAALAILAAAGAGAFFWDKLVGGEPPPLSVRTMVPSPASVYRWFEVTAQVKAAPSTAASLPAAGKVVEILPAGSKVAPGDVIVNLDIAKRARGEVAHNKERLAYYQQMLESMRAAGNRGEVRQAEMKIEEKQKLLAAALADLEKVAVVAKAPGVVAEALVAVGEQIKAGQPLVRMKGGAPSATFTLGKELAAEARKSGFCRAEVAEKPIDCSLAGGEEDNVVVELPAESAGDGALVRLARARFDGVFPVPNDAVVRAGDTDRLWIATPAGRAELRAIAVAERGAEEVLVSQGLDVGDQVILAPPAGLAAGSRVVATPVK